MERLAKALAAAGVASRRACEKLIQEGKVAVNGQVVKLPQRWAFRNKSALNTASIGDFE